MARHLLVTLALLLVTIPAAYSQVPAQDTDEDTFPTLRSKHQVGLRLGGWINGGDEIPELAIDTVSGAILQTSIKSGSFYFEVYGAYSVLPQTFIELSIGIVNRGSVTIEEGPFQDVGNLIVYPILLQLKWYPVAALRSKFQPYVGVGGGIYHGRQDVQFSNNVFFSTLREDHETDINYTLAAGADWLLNDFLALEFHGRYMPIKFSNALVTATDYNAVSITVGIKYLYRSKK